MNQNLLYIEYMQHPPGKDFMIFLDLSNTEVGSLTHAGNQKSRESRDHRGVEDFHYLECSSILKSRNGLHVLYSCHLIMYI